MGAGRGERAGGLQAEAGVAAGDDRQFPGEVDAPQDVVGGAGGAEPGTDPVLGVRPSSVPLLFVTLLSMP